MTRQALAALIMLLLADSSPASAEEHCSALMAPPSLSLRDTGFDVSRAACGADTLAAGTRVFRLFDTEEKLGTLSGSLFLDYRFLHESGFEFGAGARVVDYRLSQPSLGIESEVSFGPIHLSALRPSSTKWFGKKVELSHAIRVDIPFTNTSDAAFTLSVSPSVIASMFLSEQLQLHGRLAGLLFSFLPESGSDNRAAGLASLDLSYAPLSFAAVLVGAEAQGGWYESGLDHLQARTGIRIAAGRGAAMELSAGVTVAGKEGTDIVTWFGYRRSLIPEKQIKPSRLQDWAR